MKSYEEIRKQLATSPDNKLNPFTAPAVGFKPPVIKKTIVEPPKPPETAKAKILREYNYIESDIPVNDPYWGMLP